jgi:hypothetical protein
MKSSKSNLAAKSKEQLIARQAPVRVLEKATVEYSSLKTQFLLGSGLALIVSLIAQRKTFGIGFMAGDIASVSAISQALHGQFEALKSNSASLILSDFFLFHMSTAGYHLVSWLMAAFCTILVGLITLEITGRLGNRTGALAAFWAALLYAVYPSHVEAVALIGQRSEILIALFYLSSVFLYLRFQLINEKSYLIASLATAILALTSVSAISLPLVITALAMSGKQSILAAPGNNRTRTFVIYWSLAALSVAAHWPHSFNINVNLLTLIMPFGSGTASLLAAIAPLAVVTVLFIAKSVYLAGSERRSGYLAQVLSVFVSFIAISFTSSNQFLASAPLAILVAVAALEMDVAPRRTAIAFIQSGLFALSILFLSWSYSGSRIIEPVVEADRLLKSFTMQAEALRSTSDSLILVNIPRQYEGVTLTKNNNDLALLLSQPFTAADYSSAVSVIAQENDLIDLGAADGQSQIYLWNQKEGKLNQLDTAARRQALPSPPDPFGSAVNMPQNKNWQWLRTTNDKTMQIVDIDNPSITINEDGKRNTVRLTAPEKEPATLWLAEEIVTPVLHSSRWLVGMRTASDKITLTVKNLKSGASEQIVGRSAGPYKFFDLRQCHSYIFSQEPQQLGITLEKGSAASIADFAFVDFQSLKSMKMQEQK